MTYLTRDFAEDVYDLIKVHALSASQNDWWADLCREHAEEAAHRIHQFIGNKNMEWEGNVVRVGKHITITVDDNRYTQEIIE